MSTHMRTSAHTHFRDTHPFATAATQMATGMTGRAAAAAAATYKTTGLHQTEACMNGTQHSAPPRFKLCLGSDFLGTTTRPLLSGPIMSNTLRGSRPQSRQSLPAARAAKLPTGVEPPKEEPKLPSLFWGFTEDAEVWNSRAAMIGIFGIIAVEANQLGDVGFELLKFEKVRHKDISYGHQLDCFRVSAEEWFSWHMGEQIINKGILQLLGIEVGKGLDLPL